VAALVYRGRVATALVGNAGAARKIGKGILAVAYPAEFGGDLAGDLRRAAGRDVPDDEAFLASPTS
jgi:hypothetical protein